MANYTKQKKISAFFLNLVAILLFVVMIFPLYWMITASFKKEVDIFLSPPQFFPVNPSLQAYTAQLTSNVFDIFQGLGNSMFISCVTMVLAASLSILAAYGLARFRIHGKKVILLLFLISQMLPQVATLVPNFLIFKSIGLYNTYGASIFADATLGIPFCVLMMRTYFLSVSKEIDEAARIDGCTSFQSFVRIMLPICSGGIAVSFVFSFLPVCLQRPDLQPDLHQRLHKMACDRGNLQRDRALRDRMEPGHGIWHDYNSADSPNLYLYAEIYYRRSDRRFCQRLTNFSERLFDL